MDKDPNAVAQRPVVSVLIPTFNRARYIGAAIDSVLQQTLPPSQVIIVDDGSTDDTEAVLEKYRERIEVVRKPNGGKASALNLGLNLVTGDVIWVFDDDDVAVPDALERLVCALEANPECGFAFGTYDHLIHTPEGETKILPIDLEIDESVDLKLAVLERCFIFQPGMIVRKSCYQEVGPFDEQLVRSQDYEMLIRLSRRFRGVKVEGILFHQRQHGGMRGSATVKVASDNLNSAWKHYDGIIFRRVYDTLPLTEYLPPSTQINMTLPPTQELGALLERSCIMARKGIWDRACADFKTIQVLTRTYPRLKLRPIHLATVMRFFGTYSNANRTMEEAGDFFTALKDLTPRSFRWEMTWYLFVPLLRECLRNLRHRRVRPFARTTERCIYFWCKYLRAGQSAAPCPDPVSRVQSS